jgi:hypothetical protein
MSKGAAGNWIKLVSSIFLGRNCNLKVMMSPYTKIFFHGKHGTISADYEGKKSKFPEFYDNF